MRTTPVTVCAHRGASGTRPENTLPAFQQAIALECEMVEFDVRMTSDGHCTILHDQSVDRTTNGSGSMWELSLEQVKALDAGSSFDVSYAGETIPTLDELLDALPLSLELNIHVYPGPEDSEAIVREVCRQIKDRGRFDTAFIAGSEAVMDLVLVTDAEVRRCLLGSQNDPESYVRRCREYDCTDCQPSNRIVSKDFCDAAHQAGMKVNPFYADDEPEMQRLIECGVDGILTNYSERMIDLLKQLNLR